MGSTVSRRVIFVKTKSRRARPKPKPQESSTEKMVGDAARPMTPLRAPIVKPEEPAGIGWRPLALGICGLLAVIGVIVGMIGMFGDSSDTTKRQSVSASSETTAAYAKARPAGYAGAGAYPSGGGGYPGARGSVAANQGGQQADSPISKEQAFLNAPFRKRKAPNDCAVATEVNASNLGDLKRCLEQGN